LVVLSCNTFLLGFVQEVGNPPLMVIATSIVKNILYIGNTSQLGDIVGHSKWSERPCMPRWSTTINFGYPPPNFHSWGCKHIPEYKDFLVSQWQTFFWSL
jgi:hypothetical protein